MDFWAKGEIVRQITLIFQNSSISKIYRIMKTKIVLTGNFGVGKTAIRKRLLSNNFVETYTPSIGVYVDKVTLRIKENSFFIWDVPGEVTQSKIPLSHFLGSQLVLYVVDLTRPSTYVNILEDVFYLKSILPNTPILTVGNKIDLIDANQLLSLKISFSFDLMTSAKTGENINQIFLLPTLFSNSTLTAF